MSKLFGHNFGTVYRFEMIRTMKKKMFWLSILIVPAIIFIIAGISVFSQKTSHDNIEAARNASYKIAIIDDSGLINKDDIAGTGAHLTRDLAGSERDLMSKKLDAVIHYPKNLSNMPVTIDQNYIGMMEGGRYEDISKDILSKSAKRRMSDNLTSMTKSTVRYNTQNYRDGKPINPIAEMIAPGALIVVFYLILSVYGSMMVNSTTEEKENRVTEIILTTINSRTFISAKIMAYISLIFVQIFEMVGILVLVFAGLRIFKPEFAGGIIPFISQIPLDPVRLGVGFGIFVLSLMLICGALVGMGAVSPTAKEASQYTGIVMMLVFIPLYALNIYITAKADLVAQILMYFPFTAPIPLLVRNAMGYLTMQDVAIVFTIMIVSIIVVMLLAAKLFQIGAISYNKKLSLKSLGFVKKVSKLFGKA